MLKTSAVEDKRLCARVQSTKSNKVRMNAKTQILLNNNHTIAEEFDSSESIVVYPGDCLDLLKSIPDESLQLVVTSPPYNIGKEYEKKLDLDIYLQQQAQLIAECVRSLSPNGSICWQVGNYVDRGAIIPLDTVLYPIFSDLGLRMRNRIIWHFEHGLHCSRRFSGRYETIVWFTKSQDYVFNLDPVRIPQKYPGKKHFKGPKAGQYSGNPLGKNPGDMWVIPNVKSNHVEKTEHPCQFPVELIERLVLSLTNEGDWVLDPFLGTGTSIIAAIRHRRRGVGAEIIPKYVDLARERIEQQIKGTLRTRPMHKPVYDPIKAGNSLTVSPWNRKDSHQKILLEKSPQYPKRHK
jgi:adenine-specific DNA-methyltransferase